MGSGKAVLILCNTPDTVLAKNLQQLKTFVTLLALNLVSYHVS